MPSSNATLTEELNPLGSHSDYFDKLVFFELAQPILDDTLITETVRGDSLTCELIQSIHVLNGQRHLLVLAKSRNNIDRLDTLIISLFKENYPDLRRVDIPLTSSNVAPLLLIAELNESQLKVVDIDAQAAIRRIEAKTGLQHLKQTKHNTVYLTGILFQFVILNDFLKESGARNLVLNEINQNVKKEIRGLCSVVSETDKAIPENNHKAQKVPYLDWRSTYEESEVKGHFRIRPKHQDEGENNMPDIYYDIYMFVADLTDLNTDGLVNAANPDLHPGYVGDGIARRIRAKGGKQMQDACKKIIRQERNNENIQESEVIIEIKVTKTD